MGVLLKMSFTDLPCVGVVFVEVLNFGTILYVARELDVKKKFTWIAQSFNMIDMWWSVFCNEY